MDDDFKGTPNPLNPLVRNPLAEEPEVEEPKVEEPEPEVEEPEPEAKETEEILQPEKSEETETAEESKETEEAETPKKEEVKKEKKDKEAKVPEAPTEAEEPETTEEPEAQEEPKTPEEPKESKSHPKPSTPTRMRRIEDLKPANTNPTPELVDDFAPLTADDFEPVEPMRPVQAPRPAAPVRPARSARPARLAQPVQPTQPMQMAQDIQPVQMAQDIQPMRPMGARPMPQPTPMPQPVPQDQPSLDTDLIQQIGVVTNLDGTRPMDSMDPTNRPMKKAAEVVAKPQKKKTGPIVGIIISLLVAVTCITVAVLIIIRVNKPDPMTAAVEKIMREGLPEKVAVNGDINIDIYNKTLGISKVNINLESELMPNSLMNTTKATMNLILRDGGEVSMTADEVYAANGDLYIKTENLAEVMDVFIPDKVTVSGGDLAETEETPVEGEAGEVAEADMEVDTEVEEEVETTGTMEVLEQVTDAIEVLDDEWIRISTNDFDSLVSATTERGDPTICTARMMIDTLKTRNTVAEAYLANPFIASTDKDVPIENNNYQVQRLAIDGEKFTGFIDGSSGSLTAVGNYLECLGYDKTALNADSLIEKLAQGPAIYAEIDGDNNFSRFYLIGNIGDEDNLEGQITADINISYPENVNVSEPTEYTDSSEVLQNVLQTIKENAE